MDKQLPVEIIKFKLLREELNLTQQAFAEQLGIKNSTADIERGKSKLTGKIVTQLLEIYKINPLWLYGTSQVKYLKTEPSVMPKVIALDATGNESILLVNQKAAAGYPHNIQDTDWVGKLPTFNLPLPQFRNATYRGFQVEGDSMMPNIRPNDWVLGKALSSFNEVVEGKIYIVVLEDSVLVKKLQKVPKSPQKIKLISFNSDYLPIEVNIEKIKELWMVNSKLTFGLEEPKDSNLLKELQHSMNQLKKQINALKA